MIEREQRPMVLRYLRISTDRQEHANQEPDVQRLAASRYPLERFDHRTFRETVSGASTSRPVWDEVIELARTGYVRAVVVWSLDRVGRSFWESLEAVRRLDRWGVHLVSVKEPWCDTGSGLQERQLLLSVFCWIAQFERERLRDRTRAGMERARAQGAQIGRPRTLTEAQAEEAAALNRGGWSWRQIAARLRRDGCEISYEALRQRCQEMGLEIRRRKPRESARAPSYDSSSENGPIT